MEKVKKSNFELLRILSIFLITMHHISMTYGIESDNIYIRLWAQFFYIGGKVGVNCFVLISGYFLCDQKFNIKRIIRTHTKVVAYCVLGILTAIIVQQQIGIMDILKTLLPITFDTYWFVTAYIGMLVFCPILNWIVDKANLHQLVTLIISSLLLFTIIPTFTAQTIFNSNLTWFCLMYLAGAYFRKYNTKLKYWLSQNWVFPVMWMLIWLASVILTIGEQWVPALREGTNFFTGMYILPQVINSVSLFLILEKKMFINKKINFCGKHTFAGYLIQSNFIFLIILHEMYLQAFAFLPTTVYPIIVVGLAVAVLGFAIFFDAVFDILLESKMVTKLDELQENIIMASVRMMQKIFEVKM